MKTPRYGYTKQAELTWLILRRSKVFLFSSFLGMLEVIGKLGLWDQSPLNITTTPSRKVQRH